MALIQSSIKSQGKSLQIVDISDLIKFYEDDLPSAATIDSEFHCWSLNGNHPTLKLTHS